MDWFFFHQKMCRKAWRCLPKVYMNTRTGPQPDTMWRTNAVEEEHLTHCQKYHFNQSSSRLSNKLSEKKKMIWSSQKGPVENFSRGLLLNYIIQHIFSSCDPFQKYLIRCADQVLLCRKLEHRLKSASLKWHELSLDSWKQQYDPDLL